MRDLHLIFHPEVNHAAELKSLLFYYISVMLLLWSTLVACLCASIETKLLGATVFTGVFKKKILLLLTACKNDHQGCLKH